MRKGGVVCANELWDSVSGCATSGTVTLYIQAIFPGVQESLEVFRRHDRDAVHRTAVYQLALNEAVVVLARNLNNIRFFMIAALLVLV